MNSTMNDDPRDNTSAGQRSMAMKLMYIEIYSNTANGLQMIAMLHYKAEGRMWIFNKQQRYNTRDRWPAWRWA